MEVGRSGGVLLGMDSQRKKWLVQGGRHVGDLRTVVDQHRGCHPRPVTLQSIAARSKAPQMIERLRGYWPIRLAGAKSFARVAPEAILVSTLAVQKSLGKEASFAQAERTVDAVIEGIKIGVKKTKSVQLIGFGTFKNCHTQGAHGRQSKDRRKDQDQGQKDGQIRTRKAFKEIL